MILFKRHHHGPEPPAHYRPIRRRRLNDASEMTVPLPQSSATTSSSVMETRRISKCSHFPTTLPSTCPNLTSFCTLPNVTFPTSFVRKRQPCRPQPPRTTAGISSLPTELLLKVLFHLPLIDIIQVAQTSRKALRSSILFPKIILFKNTLTSQDSASAILRLQYLNSSPPHTH
ncbi:hypothetical protein L211DRAFT_70897 [Terfezia boudieri ATCC MYA-4762]|uniref:F-box domain-containing protein n=1 Tax=Terfezia boudieri ATCC MYA-4762 TaxID=1051890 RepID=A0A3N4LSY2_9PEZI|nr:hypothetical protein L211DRAFT_70897 [Terfezia boudieri ATCC MYA-4762]